MTEKRRDKKGRILRKGELQRSDGVMLVYKCGQKKLNNLYY